MELKHTTYEYFTKGDCWLKEALDAGYTQKLYERWNKAKVAAKKTIDHIKEYKEKITPFAMRNYNMWYYDYKEGGKAEYEPVYGNLFEDQYQFLIDFLTGRMQYFNVKWKL